MGARKGAKVAAVCSSPLTKWGIGAERSEAVRGYSIGPKSAKRFRMNPMRKRPKLEPAPNHKADRS